MESKWSLKSSIKLTFPIAATYFGILCGPSMAGGTYATQYFTRWGGWGFLFILLWMFLSGLGLYFGLTIVRAYKAQNYRDYYNGIYGEKVYKRIGWVLDIYSMLSCILGEASQLAMGGVVFNTLFGWPNMVGAILMAVIFTIIMLYGAEIIRMANAWMTYALLAGFALLLYFAISMRGDVMVSNMSFSVYEAWGMGALGAGLWTITQYGWSGMNGAQTLSAVSQPIRNRKDVLTCAILSPVLAGLLFFVTTLITLAWSPEVLNEGTPNLTITLNYIADKAAWMIPVYYVIIFFALATSGPALVFALAARYKNLVMNKTGMGEKATLAVLSVIVNIVCVLVSNLGLTAIVAKGFTTMGTIAFPLIIIPMIFYGFPKAYKKLKAEEEAQA